MFGFGKDKVESKVRDQCRTIALKSIVQNIEAERAYHGDLILWLMINSGAFKTAKFSSYLNGWVQGYLKNVILRSMNPKKYGLLL